VQVDDAPSAVKEMKMDRLEKFKSHFYEREGWDVETGWPTRKTLEELSLNNIADKLGSKGKRGSVLFKKIFINQGDISNEKTKLKIGKKAAYIVY
jgi:hypothetical protein